MAATLKISGQNSESDRYQGAINCLLFHRGRVYSGSKDGKLQVWDANLRLLGDCQGYENSHVIHSLAVAGDRLYSSGSDNTIKKWDIITKKFVSELVNMGKDTVHKLYGDNGLVYAADSAGYVEIYEGSNVCGHIEGKGAALDVVATGDFLYTVRDSKVIIQVKGDNEQYTVKGQIDGREPLAIAGKSVCACTADKKNITVHRIKDDGTVQIFCTITGSDQPLNAISGVQIGNDSILFSGGNDKIIKRWIISGDKPLPGGCAIVPTPVTAICAGNEGQVYVGGEKGLICRLDLS